MSVAEPGTVLSLDRQRADMPTDATGDGFRVIAVDQFLYPGYLPSGYIDHEQDFLVTECIGKLGQMDVGYVLGKSNSDYKCSQHDDGWYYHPEPTGVHQDQNNQRH